MEKVLAAIDGRQGGREALSHAISLAQRMAVQLHILLVVAEGASGPSGGTEEMARHIELIKASAQADGIPFQFFIAEGNFEEEVINFINGNGITLLVIEEGQGESARPAQRGLASWRTLRHRIACRIDVVAPKKTLS